MLKPDQSKMRGYLLALSAVGIAAGARWAATPVLGSAAGFFLVPPVLIAAWYAGVGPAILATSLSAIAAWWFLTLTMGSEPFPEYHHWFTGASFFSVCGILAWFTVMARRHADAAKRSEQRAQELLETANEGVWLLDADGRTEYINGRMAELLGYTQEEIWGRAMFDFMDASAASEAKANWQHRKQGSKAQHDFRFRCKDGSNLWAIVSTNARYNTQGQFVGALGMITNVTDRREAEERLRRSEQRLSLHVQHTPLAVIEWTMDGKVSEWNPSAERIFGYSREEMIGSSWTRIVPEWEQERLKGVWASLSAHKGGERSSNVNLTSDGREIICEWYNTPLVDLQGQVIGVASLVQDVTEQHRAERALRANEERLQMAINAAQLGLWDSDAARDEVWWSEKMWDLLRLDKSARPYTYAQFIEQIHPDDRAAVLAARDRAAGGAPLIVEFRMRRGDGTQGWFMNYADSQHDAEGTPLRTVGACRDITRRKEADKEREKLLEREQAARHAAEAAERKFRDLVEGLDAVVLEVDSDNDRFSFVSPKVESMFGYPMSDWMDGDHTIWGKLVHPEDRCRVFEFCSDETQAGRNHQLEYRAVTADQRIVWIQEIVYLYRQQTGPLLLRALLVDVTERKAAERELKAAKEAAEAADRAKDQFLAILSHELRTPLTPVLAAVSSLVAEDKSTGELHSTLEMVQRNVALEARLIDDLLDLTRVRKGKLQLHRRALHAHASLRAALEICNEDIEEKSLNISLDLSAGSHHVNADPARLQQVFWNLIKNAVKFTPPRGTVSFRSWNEDGQLVVEVKDTGIGMEPAVLAKIFSAFEQGDATVNRRFGGLGLGLVISRSVVEMHGGTLVAHSDGIDKGSTFIVHLASIPVPVEEKPAVEKPALAARQSLRILLVEDNRDTLGVMARLLNHSGHKVQTADTMEAALRNLSADGVDLLISDIGLPDGSGLELLGRARQEIADLRAIALSGFGTDADMEKSREAGFAVHLTKPILYEVLESAIASVMEEGQD